MAEPQYDKEQLRVLRNAFKAFDHDDKGYIEHADVHQILEILGQKLDEKAVKALIKEVDKGTTGKLNFSQFCKLAARFVEVEEDGPVLMGELKEAFRVYDKEGKGYLTVQTLRNILHELDDKLSNQDLDMIIEEIDADGSGTVDFDEFVQVMTGKNMQDILVHQRFTFQPHSLNLPTSRCPCPSHRQRLHRRLEMQCQRFLQQLWHPLSNMHDRCVQRYVWHVQQPASEYKPSSYKETTTTMNTTTTTMTSSLAAGDTAASSSLTSSSSSSSTSVLYCRPRFRPRFPKWVPILTLYREIIQNPFRRHRCRYMITHK